MKSSHFLPYDVISSYSTEARKSPIAIYFNHDCTLLYSTPPPAHTSSPESPPTPPTVRLRKKATGSRFTPLLTTMSMDGASADSRHDISPKEHRPVELRVALHRTQSLPPRSKPSVPKLELPSKSISRFDSWLFSMKKLSIAISCTLFS